MGSLLTQPRSRLKTARPGHLPDDLDTSAYLKFLTRLAAHPLLREISRWDVSDSTAGVILAKLMSGAAFPQIYAIPAGTEAVDFARRLGVALDRADPESLWRNADPGDRPDLTKLFPRDAMARIETNLRRLDPDELRFIHRYGPRFSGSPDPRELLDMFTLLELPPSVRMTVSQVMRLLPRVSQTAGVGSAQAYPMGGFDGLSRKGSLDSILPTELAYPEEIFMHRVLNQEALYYGREGDSEYRRELAYIVTQAGTEMMGDGEILARGLTLALAQTMRHRGCDIQQSFAGSEWTPPAPVNRPADVHRVLYYQDREWLRPKKMLKAALGEIRGRKEKYRDIRMFWVLGEHWDADHWESHADLYRELKSRAGQQAWFIRIGGNGEGKKKRIPVTVRQFHRYQVVESEMIWRERDDVPALREPEWPPPPSPLPRLRKDPLMVSDEDAERVFGLTRVYLEEYDVEVWKPVEYIRNNFEEKGDIIIDHATGLMWQKGGSDDELWYEDVQAYVEQLNRDHFAGYDDWRLPTTDELTSLFEPEEQSNDLYINPIFDRKQRWCWSSDERESGGAWVVGFYGGYVYCYDTNLYVRVVRS